MILQVLFFFLALSVWGQNPDVFVFSNPAALGESAARKIVDLLLEKKRERVVLGLATGSTPLPFYEAFKKIVKEESVDLSNVVTFNLDEYMGIPLQHPQSYFSFMFEHLFNDLLFSPKNPFGMKRENIHLPKGYASLEADLSKSELDSLSNAFPQRKSGEQLSLEEQFWISTKRALEYETLIQELGPIDLQILGIGLNGHIGFAEPGTSFESKTMVIRLTEETRQSNARFFNHQMEAVPLYAISMGIGTILQAKEIWLLATGSHKASIIADTIQKPVSEEIPSTALRLHPKVCFLLDSDAAINLITCPAKDHEIKFSWIGLDKVKNESESSSSLSSHLHERRF